MRLCKVIAIQWRNCINNCFNLFFQSGSKKYQNIVFLLIFRTRYVRWIFLNPSYTAPSGLSCQVWHLDRHTSLADRCLPGLPEGNPLWTPLNKLGNQEDSPSPMGSLIRGANLAFSPRYSPFHLCHRNFNLLIWQPLFPPRTKSNQGFFPAYARIFSFF